MKTIFTSKTMWFSVLVMVLGSLQAAQTLNLDQATEGYLLTLIGAVTAVLRFMTSTAIVDHPPVQGK